MFFRIRYSSFFAAILVVLAVASWLVFLPIQFGGATAYVIINGNSMEPTYYKGDLVITRREASYTIGDVVTYFSNDINNYVIHRIIAEKAGVFVLQGDNNSWVDNDQPEFDAIIGKAWIYIPGMGTWLERLQTPFGISLLSGLIVLILISMYFIREKELRRRIAKFLSGSRITPVSLDFSVGEISMKQIGRQLEILVFVFVIFFGASLLLAFVAFGKEETFSKTVDSEYLHVGIFSYSAPAEPGVYDPGSPKTGDPIFLQTTCSVNLRFDYRLAGQQLTDAGGTISMRAETLDVNGWQRSFPLEGMTEFSGSTAFIQTELNPCQILSVLRQAEEKTGLRRSSYQLLIVPDVNIKGSRVDGVTFESGFAPTLVFSLDELQLFVQPSANGGDALSQFEVENQAIASQLPNLIQFPGFAVTVRVARIVSLVGLLGSLGLGFFVGYQLYAALKKDPTVAISLRYGALLVEVEQVSFNVRSRDIVVSSFEDLVKLAERNATVILHLRHPNRDEFLVEGANMVYRFDLPRRKEIGSENP